MLFSDIRGNGFPVVFLHGYGENLSLWDKLTDYLSTEYQTISVDLPGFGQSKALEGPFSIEDVAETVYDYLSNDINLSEYVIFGHSLGGYVTLAMADLYPENIKGFGLINSTSLEDSPEKKDNRAKTAQFIEKHGGSFFLKSFVPNLFMEENRYKLEQEISFVESMARGVHTSTLVHYMQAMKNRPDRQYLLKKYEHVLFIGGENDSQFSDDAYNRQLRLLRDQEFGKIIENTGHMIMYEAPDDLQKLVYSFLKSIITD